MALKISPEHIQILREAMQPFLNRTTAEVYADAGLSEKRYRWDAFWSACKHTPTLNDTVREIYKTCDDTHLDSVFRMLAKERADVEIAQ